MKKPRRQKSKPGGAERYRNAYIRYRKGEIKNRPAGHHYGCAVPKAREIRAQVDGELTIISDPPAPRKPRAKKQRTVNVPAEMQNRLDALNRERSALKTAIDAVNEWKSIAN